MNSMYYYQNLSQRKMLGEIIGKYINYADASPGIRNGCRHGFWDPRCRDLS